MNRHTKHILLGVISAISFLLMLIPFAPVAFAAGADCASQGLVPLNDPHGQIAESDKLCCPKGYQNSTTQCIIGKYVNPTIKVLSWIVGIVVVGGITYGGILYASSEGDSNKVTKAKATIVKSLTALVAFMVLGAFLQFLSPGSLTTSTISTGDATAAQCAAQHTFLGLKPWYAYLPNGTFNADCTFKSTVTILPSDTSKGVVPQVALAIVDDLLRVAAVVAVAFVITGGVKYATSQGEPAETKSALSTIINALIGLATAMVATAVVSYIGNKLSGQ